MTEILALICLIFGVRTMAEAAVITNDRTRILVSMLGGVMLGVFVSLVM